MKKLIITALALTTFTVKAQYFQHIYGSTDFEEVSSGMNTTQTGDGFLLGGTRNNGGGTYASMMRTDIAGIATGSPYFKNNYKLYQSSSLSVNMPVRQAFVAEINPTRFGIVGVINENSTSLRQFIFYAPTDDRGNPMVAPLYNIRTYEIPGSRSSYVIRNIRLSSTGNELYISGLCSANSIIYTMVLKIDALNGNIIWSGLYKVNGINESAYDILEDVTNNELIVVGYNQRNISSLEDAYIMKLDATTGNVASSTAIYGTNNHDAFTCIAPTSNGDYVVGGRTGVISSLDSWTLRFDNTLTNIWNTQHDYVYFGSQNNYCIDILERINTSGRPEVYAAGQTVVGSIGQSDIEVYKIDGNTGLCSSRFTYGTGLSEYVASIDQRNLTGPDGISLFGLTNTVSPGFGNNDYCIFKAYYDGITTCNYEISNTNSTPGPGFLGNDTHVRSNSFSMSKAWIQNVNTFADLEICSADDPGSLNSNDRVTSSTQNPSLVLMDPLNETISLTNHTKQYKSVLIYDINGRKINVTQTEDETAVRFNTSQLEKGVYFIHAQLNDNTIEVSKFVKNW